MQNELDFSARYEVAGYRGIAFYLEGYATEDVEPEPVLFCELEDCPHDGEDCYLWPEEYETVENLDMVRAVMVGDDRVHLIDVDDLTPISEDDYCAGCGQIGCGHWT